MRKWWLQRLENHLPYLSQWRLISTAPYNRELELRITDGETVTLEFPCLRTNEEAWINVDLGTEIKVQPVEWRIWQGGKSPEPHHSKIRLAARRALTSLYLRHVKRQMTTTKILHHVPNTAYITSCRTRSAWYNCIHPAIMFLIH